MMGYEIRHDYRAAKSSGTYKGKNLIVIHDMEANLPTTAAEAVGRYFASQAARGSTQYGIDNDSIQQYLPDEAIPWGAPYANTKGIHIEMMGLAKWTKQQWKTFATGTIDRTAWLIAHLSKKHDIPIRTITDEALVRGGSGVTTHRQCTRAFHVYGGHIDPGTGFPFSDLMKKAKYYREEGTVNIKELKKLMLEYAKSAKIMIPDGVKINDKWGVPAQTLAWRVSGRMKDIPQSTKPTSALYKMLKR